MNAPLRRLVAEIRFDRETLAGKVQELADLELAAGPGHAGDRARAAVALHHGYGAVESIMARVTRFLEGDLPAGPDWHQALLHAMELEIDGVRPPVFSPQSSELLRRLLAFRHFFRHAYAVELDAARLDALARELQAGAPRLLEELVALERFLDEASRHG